MPKDIEGLYPMYFHGSPVVGTRIAMTGYIELLTRKEVIGSLDFVTAEHSPREGEIML